MEISNYISGSNTQIFYNMPLNKIFQAVKKYCPGESGIDVHDCYKAIKEHTDISEKEIKVYLDILENMKLITYAHHDKKAIKITELGMKTNKLPSSVS